EKVQPPPLSLCSEHTRELRKWWHHPPQHRPGGFFCFSHSYGRSALPSCLYILAVVPPTIDLVDRLPREQDRVGQQHVRAPVPLQSNISRNCSGPPPAADANRCSPITAQTKGDLGSMSLAAAAA
ncbi:unnamed protein product, partial [Scytosiphon promiscuus]